MFLTTGQANNSDVLKSQMSGHHAVAFYPTDSIVGDLATTPFLSLFDRQLFAQNRDEELNSLDPFLEYFVPSTIMLEQSVEIYKILTVL